MVQQEMHEVPTPSGPIRVRCWEPGRPRQELVVVTVHPWASLGGSEYNTVGIAKALAEKGVRTLTFNLRSSSMVWGVLSNHRSEVSQVDAICRWAHERWHHNVVLFGSSAGAPIAGTVLPRLDVVTRYVGVGYTWGWLASIAFGRHFQPILQCEKPKLFIMGEHDEFTSTKTLHAQMAKAKGDDAANRVVVVPGVGHFELESSQYDGVVANHMFEWLMTIGT